MTWGDAPLRVEIVGDRRYRVTGGQDPHAVERDAAPGTWRCDCRGFAYRQRCTHIAAVLMFRERICAPCPPALAAYVDRLTDDDVLALCDIVGPSAHVPETRLAPSALEAEAAAILERCETRLLELEADLAASMGHRTKAWWLRARAAARSAP